MELKTFNGKVYKLVGKCQPLLCGAYCCRHITAKVDFYNPDDALYFHAHGCSVQRTANGDKAILLIPVKCKNLDEDSLLCTKYLSRFSVCKNYARKEGDIFFHPKCSLFWKPLTEEEYKKYKKGEL